MKKILCTGLTSIFLLCFSTILNAQTAYIDENGNEYRAIVRFSDLVGIPGVTVSYNGVILDQHSSLATYIETGEGGEVEMEIVGKSRARTGTDRNGYRVCRWAPWKGCLESCSPFQVAESDPIIYWNNCMGIGRGDNFIQIKSGDTVFYCDDTGDFLVKSGQ